MDNKINLKDILNRLKESGVDLKLIGEVARGFNYSYISGYENCEKKNDTKMKDNTIYCYKTGGIYNDT